MNEIMLVGDFETTVYPGQTSTEVWASAVVEIGTENVLILHSISETLDYFISLKQNVVCYYHNLKFDGAFWLDFLMSKKQFKTALSGDQWLKPSEMPSNSIRYNISSMGNWYSILIKTHGHTIELRDSLKLLPFSVRELGECFQTKHRKLDMEYSGYRYAGCEITEDEQRYIANDVLVVKEALEIMFAQGHDKLTIGSCCLSEYINLTGKEEYECLHPNLYEYKIDKEQFGEENAGEYIRHAYRGGWCYLVKGKENRQYYNGVTADVNSLYPSMMSSESGNPYPIGFPHFFAGDINPFLKKADAIYYFIRVKTRFKIKKGYLPFIQIKGDPAYDGTESLTTSDIYDPTTKTYSQYRKELDGEIRVAYVTMTMTKTDWILFNEHYDLIGCEILDGCWFRTQVGLFDKYIEKYKKIKLESKGAMRTLAKLFLNNLYGKMASSTCSNFKVAYVKEDGSIGFVEKRANDKKPGYIACGAAITSYARNFTIRASQKNYYGVDKPGFIYADTDSMHLDLSPEDVKGIKVDEKNFCCWKLESSWDNAIFCRQKTYIEHIVAEDLEPIDEPYYSVKCAGMPGRCKDLFVRSMTDNEITEEDYNNYLPEEIAFICEKRTLADFKRGLIVPGKLLPKRIPGGILLVETTFEMRE